MSVLSRVEAIHTSVRRYLPGRYTEISSVGARLPALPYAASPEAQNIIPRYGFLQTFQDEIERLDPERLPPEHVLVEHLRTEAMTVPVDVKITTEAEKAGLDDERERTVAAIDDIVANDPTGTEALPYQRTLSDIEVTRWSSTLSDLWLEGSADWWTLFGRARSGPGHDIATFREEAFFGDAATALRNVLLAAGETKAIALREWGVSRQHSTSALEPVYDGAEGLFTSGDGTWILHASHEGIYTLAGWVVPALMAQWADWASALWRNDD